MVGGMCTDSCPLGHAATDSAYCTSTGTDRDGNPWIDSTSPYVEQWLDVSVGDKDRLVYMDETADYSELNDMNADGVVD